MLAKVSSQRNIEAVTPRGALEPSTPATPGTPKKVTFNLEPQVKVYNPLESTDRQEKSWWARWAKGKERKAKRKASEKEAEAASEIRQAKDTERTVASSMASVAEVLESLWFGRARKCSEHEKRHEKRRATKVKAKAATLSICEKEELEVQNIAKAFALPSSCLQPRTLSAEVQALAMPDAHDLGWPCLLASRSSMGQNSRK